MPSCFIIVNQVIVSDDKHVEEATVVADHWLDKLVSLSQNIMRALANPSTSLEATVFDLVHGESLYLYLVDEVTMQPVIVDGSSVS